MRILITGGKGFIGSHCVEHFLEQGDDILVIDHDRAGIYFTPAKYVNLNMAYDVDALEEFLHEYRPEAVIHLAAWSNVRESMANPSKLFAYNVQATANLVDVLQCCPFVKSVVFASSSAADEPESFYGISKLTGELMLGLFQKMADWNISCVCLRFGNVYGERQNPRHGTLIANGIERLMGGFPIQIYGDGTQQRDYIYVGDIVHAIEICVQVGVEGVHNASTGLLSSTKEVVDSINMIYRQVTGNDYPPPEFLPAREGDKETVALEPSPVLESHGFNPSRNYHAPRVKDQLTWRLQMKGSWDYPLTPRGENIKSLADFQKGEFDAVRIGIRSVSSLDEWLRLGGRL